VVLGLIAIWTSYWAYVDPDPGVIGFLVIIPFGIPLLLALILGPGLSIVLWRDLRLMTLTVLSIAMLIALEFLRVKDLPIPLSLYAAVCMTISLVWFVKYRTRFG
jgi:ABC-type Na+ efflux pump permease subunit